MSAYISAGKFLCGAQIIIFVTAEETTSAKSGRRKQAWSKAGAMPARARGVSSCAPSVEVPAAEELRAGEDGGVAKRRGARETKPSREEGSSSRAAKIFARPKHHDASVTKIAR